MVPRAARPVRRPGIAAAGPAPYARVSRIRRRRAHRGDRARGGGSCAARRDPGPRPSRLLEAQPHRLGRGFEAAARAREPGCRSARRARALGRRFRRQAVRLARDAAARRARPDSAARAGAGLVGDTRFRARRIVATARRRALRDSAELVAPQNWKLRPATKPLPLALISWSLVRVGAFRYLYSRYRPTLSLKRMSAPAIPWNAKLLAVPVKSPLKLFFLMPRRPPRKG